VCVSECVWQLLYYLAAARNWVTVHLCVSECVCESECDSFFTVSVCVIALIYHIYGAVLHIFLCVSSAVCVIDFYTFRYISIHVCRGLLCVSSAVCVIDFYTCHLHCVSAEDMYTNMYTNISHTLYTNMYTNISHTRCRVHVQKSSADMCRLHCVHLHCVCDRFLHMSSALCDTVQMCVW